MEEYFTFFEENPVGMHWLAKNGVILHANQADYTLLGYSKEEYIGRNISCFHVEPKVAENILEKLNQGQILYNQETCLKCKNGTTKHVLISSHILRHGENTHIGCVVTDITHLRSAELRRRMEYAITRTLAEGSSLQKSMKQILKTLGEGLQWEMGIFWKPDVQRTKLNGIEIWSQVDDEMNRSAAAQVQAPLSVDSGFLGKIWSQSQTAWTSNITEEEFNVRHSSLKNLGMSSAFGFPIRLNKEILGIVEFFSKEHRTPNEELLEMLESIGSQIGQFIERKETERKLQSSREHLEMALSAARMGYWSWDIQTNEVQWSERLSSLHGIPLGSFAGTFPAFLEYVYAPDRQLVKKAISTAVQQNSDYNIEFRIVWPNGNIRWMHGRGKVFKDENGRPLQMMGLGIDITSRRQSEEALRIAYDEMERKVRERTADLVRTNEILQAEIMERKLVEKEVLEISEKEQRRIGEQLHDGLCQDLAGISMMLKFLGQKMEKKSMLEADEIRKIAQMIDRCLMQGRDMARGLYPIELEASSLMVSLRDLTVRSQNLLNINCTFECSKPVLIRDNKIATHLYRIAQEAVHNAIKHSAAESIKVSLSQEGNQITLEVEDNGCGISRHKKIQEGIGMHIMQYRARMINAILEQTENHPTGTLVKCSFVNYS